MTKTTNGTTKSSSARECQIVKTGGEILPDDSVIEPVTRADSEELQLLHWKGQTITIAPQIEHRGRLYRPAELNQVFKKQYCCQARRLTMASCLFFSNAPATNSETILIWICSKLSSRPRGLLQPGLPTRCQAHRDYRFSGIVQSWRMITFASCAASLGGA
jgi:hypothetical protein